MSIMVCPTVANLSSLIRACKIDEIVSVAEGRRISEEQTVSDSAQDFEIVLGHIQ